MKNVYQNIQSDHLVFFVFVVRRFYETAAEVSVLVCLDHTYLQRGKKNSFLLTAPKVKVVLIKLAVSL